MKSVVQIKIMHSVGVNESIIFHNQKDDAKILSLKQNNFACNVL